MLIYKENKGETKGEEQNKLNEGNELQNECFYSAFICIYFSHD